VGFIKANLLPLAVGIAIGYLVIPKAMSAIANR
jgi:hypothetical protein